MPPNGQATAAEPSAIALRVLTTPSSPSDTTMTDLGSSRTHGELVGDNQDTSPSPQEILAVLLNQPPELFDELISNNKRKQIPKNLSIFYWFFCLLHYYSNIILIFMKIITILIASLFIVSSRNFDSH